MTRTNWERAEEGIALCANMQELTGVDTFREQIVDILTQMMHTCRLARDEDGNPVDFDEALREAREHFDYEADEEPDN